MFYYYVYKIVNKLNGHYYYGVHSTKNLDDGYMGSGVALHKAYEKYGEENFEKTIVKFFDTIEEAYEYEAEIVDEKLVRDKNCYNLCRGGKYFNNLNMVTVKDKDGNTYLIFKDDERYLNGEFVPTWKGKHHREEIKEQIREKMTPPNSTNDRVWVNKNGAVKYIRKEIMNDYLNQGWQLGRQGYKPRKGGNGIPIEKDVNETKGKKQNNKKIKQRIVITKEELLEDIKNNLKVDEAIEKYQIKRKRFFSLLRKYKIDKKEFGFSRKFIVIKKDKKNSISENDFNKMIELLKIHKNFSKVAKILGLTEAAIRKRLQRRGFPYKIKELKEYFKTNQ